MLKTIQKILLTSFLSTGFCYAASKPELYSHLFYAPTPQTLAVYIASYGDEAAFKLVADQLLNDIMKSPLDRESAQGVACAALDLQHTKNLVRAACATKAKSMPHTFCLIELFTHQHRIRSTSCGKKHVTECDLFAPYEWSRILVYPERKNDLTLVLDCKRLRPAPPAPPALESAT